MAAVPVQRTLAAVARLLPAPLPHGHPAVDADTFLGALAVFFTLLVTNAVAWRSAGWKGKPLWDTVSCGMSLVHGLTTALLSGQELLRAGLASPVDGPNSAEQIAIMQLSCAYFVLDALHVALWGLDPLFFGHHVFTTAYMLWSMALGVGGHGVMALMCIGEVTSPLLNVWSISRNAEAHGHAWGQRLHVALEPAVVVVFTLIRGVVGPAVVVTVAHGCLRSKTLPRSAAYAWAAMCCVIVLGSWLWLHGVIQGRAARLRKPEARARPRSARSRAAKKQA